METLFVLEDQYNNSLQDFPMTVDYELVYLTTDGQSLSALMGTTDKGSVMYDPNTLPGIPANFKCSQLTTNVQCDFYRVDQTDRELAANAPIGVKIPAQKKIISAQERAMILQRQIASKTFSLQNRFSNSTTIRTGQDPNAEL